MFPPPPRHPRPHPPSEPLIEVQNRPLLNILRDHILTPCDVYTDPLEACFRHFLLQWGLFPNPIPMSLRLTPGEPLRDPVLKNTQVPLHTGGRYPHLRPKQQHRMDRRLEKCPDTFGSTPSQLKIRDNRPQLFLAFWRLPTVIPDYMVRITKLWHHQNAYVYAIIHVGFYIWAWYWKYIPTQYRLQVL